MEIKKTKAITDIEGRMREVEEGTLRFSALEAARDFKSTWVRLGQILYAIYKDRNYKEWGFSTFDGYCKKEIDIRKNTAVKLLKSYYFLEENEPELIKDQSISGGSGGPRPAVIPDFESINALRLAQKNKFLTPSDYADFRRDVFEGVKDHSEINKAIAIKVHSRKEAEVDGTDNNRGQTVIKRIITTLKALRTELKARRDVPKNLIVDTEQLIRNLEKEFLR